uniref:BTB domain-containing protein n=1 Tax=Globodera rostochiensis TaxID=31243 RepID=A0A914H5D5_GLORO
MKHLQRTGHPADVQFMVGDGDEEEATKASDVFEAMFRFGDEDVKVPDMEVGVFKAMLAFIYADDLSGLNGENAISGLYAVKEVKPVKVEAGAFKVMLSFIYADDLNGLNGGNTISVLYAAKKYDVAGLIKACVDFPIWKLSNVFLAIDQTRFLGEENANVLIFSAEFLQIDQQLLCEILDRDELMISEEIAIWNAALRWADEKCRQTGKEPSAANRRAMLGPALFKIRFPPGLGLIFVQCLFMHLLSIPITFYLYNFKTPAYYTGSYVIVSSLFYAAIVTKFAWIKAHNRNWGTEVAASASDKDSVRLTLTCVAIQIVAMCQMSYISANMRTNCRQLLGKVWPFTTTKVAAIDAGLNTQIRNINVNVVGSNRLAAQQL